jgi:hypothetical protein
MDYVYTFYNQNIITQELLLLLEQFNKEHKALKFTINEVINKYNTLS